MTDRSDLPNRMDPTTGFVCLRCGCLTRVVRTRRYGITIIRRRTCDHCGYQFGTSEKPIWSPSNPNGTAGQ